VESKGLSQRVDAEGAERDGGGFQVVDPFALDAPIVSEAEKRGWTREEAIAYGRRLAEDENRKLVGRGTEGRVVNDPAGRIARAEAYAAWEYDGRQAGTIGRRV